MSSNGLNSGYIGTDQRRTKAGSYDGRKHYLERLNEQFNSNVVWTPSEIITALWLDADDASTITLNGSNVSQWNDKSGNRRDATQAMAADQPTRTLNGLNGKTVLTFNGSSHQMSSTSGTYGTNISIFVVARQNAGSGYQRMINLGNTVDVLGFFGSVNQNFATFFGANGSWNDVAANSPEIAVTSTRVLGVVNPTSGLNATPYVDGTAQNTKVGTMGIATGIGIGHLAGQYWNGIMAEIIIINSAVSADTRQNIEGYLAWKWGLQENLPANHPYKNAAPTI